MQKQSLNFKLYPGGVKTGLLELINCCGKPTRPSFSPLVFETFLSGIVISDLTVNL